jgi:hypothetical protein
MFLLLPVFALLLKLFYRQTYYLAHLVFGIHLLSASYIVFAVMISLETMADRYLAVMVLQLMLLAYMMAYFAIALRVTYQQSWLKTSLKCMVLLLLFSILIGAMIQLADLVTIGLVLNPVR